MSVASAALSQDVRPAQAHSSLGAPRRLPPVRTAALLHAALLVALAMAPNTAAAGSTKRKRSAQALDRMVRDKRRECESEMDANGGMGVKEAERDDCISTPASRENCILRCMSEQCYQQVYAKCALDERTSATARTRNSSLTRPNATNTQFRDPLEDGELDHVRGRVFRSCYKRALREEADAERQRQRQQEAPTPEADEL